MRALTWQAPNKLQVDTVPDPAILNPRDAIIRVTLSSVLGLRFGPAPAGRLRSGNETGRYHRPRVSR
nr:hypothetical protein [Pseudomonas viridiflava]